MEVSSSLSLVRPTSHDYDIHECVCGPQPSHTFLHKSSIEQRHSGLTINVRFGFCLCFLLLFQDPIQDRRTGRRHRHKNCVEWKSFTVGLGCDFHGGIWFKHPRFGLRKSKLRIPDTGESTRTVTSRKCNGSKISFPKSSNAYFHKSEKSKVRIRER